MNYIYNVLKFNEVSEIELKTTKLSKAIIKVEIIELFNLQVTHLS